MQNLRNKVTVNGRRQLAASIAILALVFSAVAVEPSRLVVTDQNVVGEVWVNNGETISIYGNGLGADATLVLDGGSIVKFFATAEISCPVIATNATVIGEFATVKYQTSGASVTGTVSGVISSASKNRMYLNTSAGSIILSGSGSITTFYMDTGHVDVTGQYDITGAQRFYGGHLKIRDGGRMSVVTAWQHLRLDATENKKSSILEVASGGVFEKCAGNQYTFLGYGDATRPSKILVNGGRFTHDMVRFNFKAGGSIEINSGTFETHAPIRCWDSATAENATITLRGGTMGFWGGGAGYCKYMFADPASDDKQTGVGRCAVVVDGNARLTLGYQPNMPDSPDDVGRATWRCTPGSRLSVSGSGYDVKTVWHNFEADGLAIDLNIPSGRGLNNATIAIADRTDTVGLGFVLPGTAGCGIITTNTSPAIAASYVVPSGQTLDTANLPDWWYRGFSSSCVSNITFDTGSTLEFPFFPGSPLAIAGKVTLPASMNFRVDVGAEPLRSRPPEAVVDPADGVDDAEECVWTCLGATRAERSAMSVADGKLCYAYTQPSMLILVK